MSAAARLFQDDQPVRMSELEYLFFEAESDWRHEFTDGVVTAMAGGSPEHSQVKSDLVGELRDHLKATGCSYYDSDLRVRTPEGRYVYPDAAAVCEEPDYHTDEDVSDESKQTRRPKKRIRSLKNPQVLFEVLSDTTEGYDRGEKFYKYMAIKSVQDYVLVLQDRPRVEVISFVHSETDDEVRTFRIRVTEGLDSEVEIPSLNVRLKLSEIYRQVTFPPVKDENNDLPAD